MYLFKNLDTPNIYFEARISIINVIPVPWVILVPSNFGILFQHSSQTYINIEFMVKHSIKRLE